MAFRVSSYLFSTDFIISVILKSTKTESKGICKNPLYKGFMFFQVQFYSIFSIRTLMHFRLKQNSVIYKVLFTQVLLYQEKCQFKFKSCLSECYESGHISFCFNIIIIINFYHRFISNNKYDEAVNFLMTLSLL